MWIKAQQYPPHQCHPFLFSVFSEYFASISLTNELNSSMCNKMLGWILKPMPSIFFTTVLLRVMWSCISRQSAFQCLHALQAPVAKGQCIPVNAYIWWNVCMHTYMHFCNGIISTLQSFCTVCLDANIPTGFLFSFFFLNKFMFPFRLKIDLPAVKGAMENEINRCNIRRWRLRRIFTWKCTQIGILLTLPHEHAVRRFVSQTRTHKWSTANLEISKDMYRLTNLQPKTSPRLWIQLKNQF